MPVGHETWFVERVPPLDWSFAREPRTLLLLGVALLVALLVRLAGRFRQGVDIPPLARLAPWMPFAVRLHLAVSLVGLLSAGAYVSPDAELTLAPVDVLLGLVMAVVAVMLVIGWRVRAAAAVLALAGALGMLRFGLAPMVQRADVLGLALFLVVAGGGRWSADWERGARDEDPRALERAVWLLRVAAGSALIAVAFLEKLANPQLAREFLDAQDVQFNLAQLVGLPVGDTEFIRFAGAVEVLFGLLLISGALPQLVVVAAGVPFNATLYFFGTIELLGHLPIYATMLVLLVYGSHGGLRDACARLWPWPWPGRAPPGS